MKMRLRRAAVVLGIGAIGISAVLSAQQPTALQRTPNGPDLDPLLVAAGRYLEQYERDVTAVIAQEDYLQRVPVEAKFRRLRSDLLIVAEANVGWVEFRDTFEVDERPVRDRDNRAADLFLKPNPNALQQAKRIAGESARFNLSPQRYAFNRTLNVPLTALRFLRRPNQSRSTFQIDRRDATGVVVGVQGNRIATADRVRGQCRCKRIVHARPRVGPGAPHRVHAAQQTGQRHVHGRVHGAAGVEAVAAGGDGRTLRLSWGRGDGWAGDVSKFRMFRVETATIIGK